MQRLLAGGSSATLGSTTSFVGTILALASVTLNTGATVDGRVFAQTGAVTLDDNVITVPTCSAPTTPTTTTTTTTTTAAPTTPTKAPVTTVSTKKPGGTGTTHNGGTGGTGGTGSTPGSSTTIIPKGAPATGEGGMAGSGSSPLGLIGLGAIVVSMSATSVAIRLRRRR